MAAGDDLLLSDPRALRALAHPLRLRLLRLLRNLGPSTATRLAERVDEVPAAVSFHLRQLQRYGFISEVAGRGKGRERWWRARHRLQRVEPERLTDPEARLAADEFGEVVLQEAFEIHARALQAGDPAWHPADSEVGLWLTPEELRKLCKEVETLFGGYIDRTEEEHPQGAELCHVTFLAARWLRP